MRQPAPQPPLEHARIVPGGTGALVRWLADFGRPIVQIHLVGDDARVQRPPVGQRVDIVAVQLVVQLRTNLFRSALDNREVIVRALDGVAAERLLVVLFGVVIFRYIADYCVRNVDLRPVDSLLLQRGVPEFGDENFHRQNLLAAIFTHFPGRFCCGVFLRRVCGSRLLPCFLSILLFRELPFSGNSRQFRRHSALLDVHFSPQHRTANDVDVLRRTDVPVQLLQRQPGARELLRPIDGTRSSVPVAG